MDSNFLPWFLVGMLVAYFLHEGFNRYMDWRYGRYASLTNKQLMQTYVEASYELENRFGISVYIRDKTGMQKLTEASNHREI